MSSEAVKLTFLFNHPEDPNAFDTYFFEHHLPLNEAVTQLRRREVAKIVGAPEWWACSLLRDRRVLLRHHG
jgi:uncharacterized protein (TIGR02118 family)